MRQGGDPTFPASALFTDRYELTMLQAYRAEGMGGTAIFELFFRELPQRRAFAIAAGLDDVLSYLESFRFRSDELAWPQVWPFLALGVLVPGFSQILFLRGVRDLGPSRHLVVMSTGPVFAGAAFLLITRRHGQLVRAIGASTRPFLVAGVLFGAGYAVLVTALDTGRVTIVSPLFATYALWGLVISLVFLGRAEALGRRTALAALLVVGGISVIGITP